MLRDDWFIADYNGFINALYSIDILTLYLFQIMEIQFFGVSSLNTITIILRLFVYRCFTILMKLVPKYFDCSCYTWDCSGSFHGCILFILQAIQLTISDFSRSH